MSDIITCPSGLQGHERGMKVRGERILADRKLAMSGGQIDELLAACWEETFDPGPYALAEGAKLDLGKVLQGDRFFALLMVRALTYGPEYAFGVSCLNDNCWARIEWEFDLTTLPVRALSEESRAAFASDNRFETMLPDAGKKVAFKLLTGDDERKLPALQRSAPDRLISAVLAYRVLDIDGVEPKAKRQFLEELSMRDADFLVDECTPLRFVVLTVLRPRCGLRTVRIDRVDCGVDTTIEFECPECFMTQEVEFPFDRGFFLPGKDGTARRRTRSSSCVTMDAWRERLFQLAWQQHGGSGLATGLNGHVNQSSGAHAASAISVADVGANLNATNVEASLAEILDAFEGDHFKGNEPNAGKHRAIRQPPLGGSKALILHSNASGQVATRLRIYADTEYVRFSINASWNGTEWARDGLGFYCSGLRGSRSVFAFLHDDTFAPTFTSWSKMWRLPMSAAVNSAFELTGAVRETGRLGMEITNSYNATRTVAGGGGVTFRNRFPTAPSSITLSLHTAGGFTGTPSVGYTDRDGFGFYSFQSLAAGATAYWFGSYTAVA